MLDQIGEQLAAPADAAFEEAEPQLGEAPGHAAEEQPLGDGVAGRREMADMVEGEVAWVVAQTKAAPAGVEGRRNAESQAFPPDRVVIVIAVEAELVVEHRMARDLRIDALGRRQRPRDAAAEHADLGAELLRDVFELLDRLFRRVHRDDRRRGQPVAERAEIIGGDDVEAADHRAARRLVGDTRDAEPGGRVDDAEIDAVQHARHHRGGAVARVGRLPPPIAFHPGAALFALLDRQRQRVGDAALRGDKAVRPLVADHLAHLLGENRRVFDPVAIAVNHRMADLLAGLFGLVIAMRAHAFLRRGS